MIRENVDLKPYNTFGIHAIAKKFASFSSVDELSQLFQQEKSMDFLILGGGSNVLLTRDFDGIVLKNDIKGIRIIKEDDDHVFIQAGAGEVWHEFVLKVIEMGYSGIENLSLIPGSVGASPMQNIGAYGVEIKDVFDSLEAYNIEEDRVDVFDKESCQFGYRESVFKRALKGKYVIVSVTYRLNKKHVLNTSYGAIEQELKEMGISDPSIKDVSNAVIRIRSSKLPDPKVIGNAGSFFKNPVVSTDVLEKIRKEYDNVPNYPAPEGKVKLAAGWLIEKAGWKGKRFDGYGVHDRQALVLVNYGDSDGNKILDLSDKIINDIYEKFDVKLEREVNVI